MHTKDRGHQRHIIVAPNAAVIVDDLGWNADNPKRHVNTRIVFVLNKLDVPDLRISLSVQWYDERASRLETAICHFLLIRRYAFLLERRTKIGFYCPNESQGV